MTILITHLDTDHDRDDKPYLFVIDMPDMRIVAALDSNPGESDTDLVWRIWDLVNDVRASYGRGKMVPSAIRATCLGGSKLLGNLAMLDVYMNGWQRTLSHPNHQPEGLGDTEEIISYRVLAVEPLAPGTAWLLP